MIDDNDSLSRTFALFRIVETRGLFSLGLVFLVNYSYSIKTFCSGFEGGRGKRFD